MRSLKVVTLNCWAIFSPLPCEYKDERPRVAAIGEKLSDGEHDVILLQEIWCQVDYGNLCKKLDKPDLYPHHQYFYSGMFSTGICIFSKYPILETFYMSFPLSGYAHKVLLRVVDWFIAKGVALACIQCGGLKVNVYVTHLHGSYSKDDDEFRTHRVTQAFQLSQFINMTRRNCDVIILGGDLNVEPTDLEHRIITTNSGLRDAWTSQKSEPEDVCGGATCSRPENSFSTNAWLEYWLHSYPNGQRLDYIMYTANHGHEVTCDKSFLSMTKIPGVDYNYSDHEGVTACLQVQASHTAINEPTPKTNKIKVLMDTIEQLNTGIDKAGRDRLRYGMYLLVAFCVLLYTSGISTNLPLGLDWVVFSFNLVLTFVIGYLLWMVVYVLNAETGYLHCEKENVRTRLRNYVRIE